MLRGLEKAKLRTLFNRKIRPIIPGKRYLLAFTFISMPFPGLGDLHDAIFSNWHRCHVKCYFRDTLVLERWKGL